MIFSVRLPTSSCLYNEEVVHDVFLRRLTDRPHFIAIYVLWLCDNTCHVLAYLFFRVGSHVGDEHFVLATLVTCILHKDVLGSARAVDDSVKKHVRRARCVRAMIKHWVVSNRETTEPELIINLWFARRPIVVGVHRVTFLFVRSSIWVFIPQSHAKKVHVYCFNCLWSLQIEPDVFSNVFAISGLEIKVSICQSIKPRVLN